MAQRILGSLIAAPLSEGESLKFAVVIKDLTKFYGNFCALDHLNLQVAEGEIFGLLGPNGAGKTTAVKILMGLLTADDGTAFVLGERVPSKTVAPRIGYMPQDLALYLDLTVEENLHLFSSLFNLRNDEYRRRLEEVLDFVGLSEWRGSMVRDLSGGMRHRLSLAISLLHSPDLLVLDEPTVGVDPELRAAFWRDFKHLTAAGKTLVMTTHYMDEARNCDRIGLLRQGRLIAQGSPDGITRSVGARDLEDAFLMLARRTT